MICEISLRRICKDDISKIENYEQAINDKENMWEIHHRLELTLDGEFAHSKAELIRLNMYYHRPYYELIFLTPKEHHKLHDSANVKAKRGNLYNVSFKMKEYFKTHEGTFKGKQHTKEAREKIKML